MSDEIIPVPQVEKPTKHYESEQFDLWYRYYTDKDDKETYGNATKSALKAYGDDINLPTTSNRYRVAAVTGHRNVRKAKDLGMVFLEHQGMNFQKLLEFALKKMQDEKTKDSKAWWDSLMELGGYKTDKEPTIEVNVPVQINNKIESVLDKYR